MFHVESAKYMDLTRLTDTVYMAEVREADRRKNADPLYIAERTVYLESLLPVISKQLRETSSWQMPKDISINESVAICLILDIRDAFPNPVSQFLSVQPWLQAWMLKKWRMTSYVGQRVGVVE